MRRALPQLLFAVLIFLVVGEVASRVALSTPAYLQRLHRGGEASRRLAVIGQIDEEGGGLFRLPSVTHHPFLGWQPAPGAHPSPHGPLTIGDDRTRATGTASTDHPRVLLLGDSFTFGDEVGDEDTWAWRLREALGSPVVNLGMLGYGLDQAVLRFEAEGADHDPDVVVLGLNTLMILRTERGFDAWAKPSFTLDGDRLRPHGVPVPSTADEALGWLSPRLPLVVGAWGDRAAAPDRDALVALSNALVARLEEDVRHLDATLVIAWLPAPGEYEHGAAEPVGRRVYEAACARHRCVDLRPAFDAARARGEDLTAIAHWTPAGHALVAEALAEALTPPDPEPAAP